MAMVVRATSSLATVQLVATNTANGAPAPENRNPLALPRPLLSLSKPSWVVRTESNVRKERIRKPDPPCVVCRGSGRLDCCICNGKGRTNHIESTMLPKGEWPKWCRSCGGSGLEYCNRCLGTGEYRDTIGFKFMEKYVGDQDNKRHRAQRDRTDSHSFTELLLNDDQSDSASEK